MKLEKKKTITKEDVFSKIEPYDVYKWELGNLEIGRSICNPLRKDNNPSLSVYMGQDGQLHHIDYADDRYKGDCIDLVCQKYGIGYAQALQKIALTFQLTDGSIESYKQITGQYTKPVMSQKRHCMIQVKSRKWIKADQQYWSQYGITQEQLKAENVYPVSELYINRRKETIEKGELVYAYWYPEGLKVYMPGREKEEKWKSSIPTKLVEGLEKLNGHKKVIISKSKKDRLCLEAVLPSEIGVINTQNESIAAYTDELIQLLDGRKVWISYDSDPAGKKASLKVNEKFPHWLHVNVPDTYYTEMGIKDWADIYKQLGPEPIIEHMKRKKII